MSIFKPKSHLREVLLYFFSIKKSTESHRLLVEAYGEAVLKQRVMTGFDYFKSGDFDVEDKEYAGKLKLVEDA